MPFNPGIDTIMIPLTKEVFGENGDRVIHGCIEQLTNMISDPYIGFNNEFCLQTEEHEVFAHPELFKHLPYSLCWVQLTLEDGKICMQKCSKFKRDPEDDAEKFYELPVETQEISLELILTFYRNLQEQRHCSNPECDGAKDRFLDLRRSVVVEVNSGSVQAFCVHCYKKMREKSSHIRLWIDGRKIPPCASLTVYK